MDKILFFDIDGTLGQHGVITESNLKALHLLKEKGYDSETVQAVDWKSYKEEQYDKLADIVRASLDMKEIYRIIGL